MDEFSATLEEVHEDLAAVEEEVQSALDHVAEAEAQLELEQRLNEEPVAEMTENVNYSATSPSKAKLPAAVENKKPPIAEPKPVVIPFQTMFHNGGSIVSPPHT